MNKLLIYILSIIVILLSAIIGLRLFAFTHSGNTTIKTYLKSSLKSYTGLPINIHNFNLDEEEMTFTIKVDEQITIEVKTKYNLVTQYLYGQYHLKITDFTHQYIHLKHANLQGRFKGSIENMQVQGRGSALDANLSYRFHIKHSKFKHIQAKIQNVNASELFALIHEDTVFEGKVDVDINLPDIGKYSAQGRGAIVLHKAFFNTPLIERKYGIVLPKQSYTLGHISMVLDGRSLAFSTQAQSNLFHIDIQDAVMDVTKQTLDANYTMTINNLALFSKNVLIGTFALKGNIRQDKEGYHLRGNSPSLGGALYFDIGQSTKINFKNLHLSKILSSSRQAPYAEGLVSGAIDISQDTTQGQYLFDIKKGLFRADTMEKNLGYQIPEVNNFTLTSQGIIKENNLDITASLHSSIVDISLENAQYLIDKQELHSQYKLFLPNIGLLIRGNRAVKRGYIRAKGYAVFAKDLLLSGQAQGLGGTIDFSYDSSQAMLKAPELFIQKLFSLLGISRYLKGKVHTEIALHNFQNPEGNFTLNSDQLLTQARMLEKLIGHPVEIPIQMKSQGSISQGKVKLSTVLTSPIAQLYLENMHIDIDSKYVETPYILNIPNLENAYDLTHKRLYGSVKLVGYMSQKETLKITGSSSSLGGDISYQRIDDAFKASLKQVSLQKVFSLLGHTQWFSGEMIGNIDYDIQSKKGIIDIEIEDFHIEKSTMTETIKMLMGKDPSSILYSSTDIHATIDTHKTHYTLFAMGKHSNLEIIEGIIDTQANTHTGIFIFSYDEYEIRGEIKGSIAHPTLKINPSSMIQNELDKVLGEDIGNALGSLLKKII
ncbi:MAG: hypothetical protein Q9M36_02320 [Sulfurovum sp.]|nr:hypothetical protein [Sulfurovum sp.]